MEAIAEMFAGEGEVSMSYDREADVLYITFEDSEAVGEHLSDDLLLRRDPGTGNVVGITVMNASETLEPGSDPFLAAATA
ncbi:MAG: DUF2283 domain-containing protein [Candidatus Nanohaloarchaea archaeon]